MHEYGIVQSIVTGLIDHVAEQGIDTVTEVRFRRSSAFDEAALLQGFAAVTVGTPLEYAQLIIDVERFDWLCPCGYSQLITADDLIGHMFRCPACSMVYEIHRAHDLKLVELIGVQGGEWVRLVAADELDASTAHVHNVVEDHDHPAQPLLLSAGG